MKALYLFAALTNSGDFLVTKKTIEYLQTLGIEVDTVIVNEKVDIDQINQYDILACGGGPQYNMRLFQEDSYHLRNHIDSIKIPIFFEGSGVYNETYFPSDIYEEKFSPEFKNFYKKIEDSGGAYGCRDYISKNVLKKNGLKKGMMIGCPAWFSSEYVQSLEMNPNVDLDIKKLIISDPGLTKSPVEQELHAFQAIKVIDYLKSKFNHSELVFTFNNGINTKYSSKCNNLIREHLEKKGIKYIENQGNMDIFHNYDDCDLHIGFRLHSHIYCLSNHIPSILIEEDVRGFGFNDCMGLAHITDYDLMKRKETHNYVPNEYLIDCLDKEIDQMIEMNFQNIRNAFCVIREVYNGKRAEWGRRILQK